MLLARAAAGDASAAADWIELDEAAHDRRFQGTGGALRRRKTTVLDLDAVLAAEALDSAAQRNSERGIRQ